MAKSTYKFAGKLQFSAEPYSRENLGDWNIACLRKGTADPIWSSAVESDGAFSAGWDIDTDDLVFELTHKSDPSRPVLHASMTAEVGDHEYPVYDETGAMQVGNMHLSITSGLDVMKRAEVAGGSAVPGVQVFGDVKVARDRFTPRPTPDQALWVAIRNRTPRFADYDQFISDVLCKRKDHQLPGTNGQSCYSDDNQRADLLKDHTVKSGWQVKTIEHTYLGSRDAYELLKVATETFLLLHCGILIPELSEARETEESGRLGFGDRDLSKLRAVLGEYLGGKLPYLDTVLKNLRLDTIASTPFCQQGYLNNRVKCPCLIELIWSYWQEEGMLVQTLNSIGLRFQNRRNPAHRDPLVNLTIDPLRPMGNLLWGFIQDEQHRLSLARRAYEYDHEYGLQLVGKAVPTLDSVDRRAKFLGAFHKLLQQASEFYRESSNTFVVPDGFPLLNALREVHLLLAEGAHNQFGDLPWTARVEMLVMQWLLARQEMREFLGGRPMMPYSEPWMGTVDTMRRIQGWSDTSVTHYHELAVFGEQIILSVRYGDWSNVADENQAMNWANYWRPEIRGYIHSYQTITGVDLGATSGDRRPVEVDATAPSIHIQRRRGLEAPANSTANGDQTPSSVPAPEPLGANGQRSTVRVHN